MQIVCSEGYVIMNIVEKLHKEFLVEASSSPILLNDLAAMEKYIAESYMGRSLIELLQNADDANSSKFYINKLKNNTYLIANNGREFTEKDLYALCRSGASTKRRKSGTIGFRGIGFKSVVNYAKTVHLISGDIKATFSREKTRKEIPDIEMAPLIRIPHVFNGESFSKETEKVLKNGYTTVFIFETENDSLENEIQDFNINCMIFLRNLSEIFCHGKQDKFWKTDGRKISKISKFVTCFDGREKLSWLVFSSEKNKPCDIAFCYDGNKVVPALKEAVVHSFMPTNNNLSIPIKINGDFSTDPSRTKITIDNETIEAVKKCGNFLSEIAINIIDSGKDELNIIKIISMGKIDPLSNIRGKCISDYFIECVHENIKKYFQTLANGKNIYYQQIGIADNDFDEIIKKIDSVGIKQERERGILGLTDLLKIIGISTIPTEKILDVMETIECEKSTRIQILADTVHNSRLGINQDIREKVKKAKLLEYENGIKSIEEQCENDIVEESYQGAVIEKLGSFSSLEWFAKQMNIHLQNNNSMKKEIAIEKSKNTKFINHIIKKWRSVEENFLQFVQDLPNVETAIDVADKNIGYDIEVTLKNSEHEYYEIKSVNRMGESFSMTNNEFSSAIQYKEKYKLAVVQQGKNQFNVCIITDPANSLNLTKRVTRWEWYCREYSGEVFQAEIEN